MFNVEQCFLVAKVILYLYHHWQTHSQIGAIAYNSVNFQARSSTFCMEVHVDPLHIFLNGHQKQNGRQKLNSALLGQVKLNLFFGCHFVFASHFVFWGKHLRRVIMNYHVKSGASSLKIDWVILNLVLGAILFFGRHFVFC